MEQTLSAGASGYDVAYFGGAPNGRGISPEFSDVSTTAPMIVRLTRLR